MAGQGMSLTSLTLGELALVSLGFAAIPGASHGVLLLISGVSGAGAYASYNGNVAQGDLEEARLNQEKIDAENAALKQALEKAEAENKTLKHRVNVMEQEDGSLTSSNPHTLFNATTEDIPESDEVDNENKFSKKNN